jgi:hypothetical protein
MTHRDTPDTSVPSFIVGIVFLFELVASAALTVKCRLFAHECSWNSCDNQAITGRVVSAEWIPVCLCERHDRAVRNMIRRPEQTPDTDYWLAVFDRQEDDSEGDAA